MRVEAHGIRADLLAGWEGRISRRSPDGQFSTRKGGQDEEASVTMPVVHLANFALPEDRGDFGSGAVDLMDIGHVLYALIEYGPDSVGTALFPEVTQMPRLSAKMFSGNALQRVQKGQTGVQRFFTLNSRAFCLYVVLGKQGDAASSTATVNRVSSLVSVAPR